MYYNAQLFLGGVIGQVFRSRLRDRGIIKVMFSIISRFLNEEN